MEPPSRLKLETFRLRIGNPDIALLFNNFQKSSKQPANPPFSIDFLFILFHNVSIHTIILSVNKGVNYGSQK